MVGVASDAFGGHTGKARAASLVGVASDAFGGHTGKARAASLVGVASDALASGPSGVQLTSSMIRTSSSIR